jgi:hypothetical protein
MGPDEVVGPFESWPGEEEMLERCLSGLRFEGMQPQYTQCVTEIAVAGIQPARVGPGAENRILGKA